MLIDKISALKIYYYLIAVDGVSAVEVEKFDDIGNEILGPEFIDIKENLISECNIVIEKCSSDDRYTAIENAVDDKLNCVENDCRNGIASRMLIWNLLTIANCDKDFSSLESQLIEHISKTLKIDESIYYEMKQLLFAAESVQNELARLNSSTASYKDIKPLVDENEKRLSTILESVKLLINDEIVNEQMQMIERKKREKAFEKTSEKIERVAKENGRQISDAVSPVADRVRKKVNPVAQRVSDAVNPVVQKAGEKINPKAQELGEKGKTVFENTSATVVKNFKGGANVLKNEAGKIFDSLKGNRK